MVSNLRMMFHCLKTSKLFTAAAVTDSKGQQGLTQVDTEALFHKTNAQQPCFVGHKGMSHTVCPS